jgi:hypothetical protein
VVLVEATLVVVEATLVVVEATLVVVVDGAIVMVGSGGAMVVVGSAMAVIAPVLVEVDIAASTVVVVETSIVPTVVDPATELVGDSVVVGVEGTATDPSPPPHAPASRKKSARVQSAPASLIIPRVFQNEKVGGFPYLVAITPVQVHQTLPPLVHRGLFVNGDLP